MPAKMITAPAGLFGEPLPTNAGMNEQIVIQCINNSGDFLRYGDVVCWDNGGALSTVAALTISGDQSGLLTTMTLTANASTGSYPSTGGLIVFATVTGSTDAAVPVFASYTGISGSTFTGVKFHTASITNGLDSGDAIFPYNASATITNTGGLNGLPIGFNYVQPVQALPTVASPVTQAQDGGRYVNLSITGAVNDPLVCGTITQGDAGSSVGQISIPNYPNIAEPPGFPVLVAVAGVARARTNTTVTALDIQGTGVTPGCSSSGTPTLGNLLGIALEANTGKDANNTIRTALKIG